MTSGARVATVPIVDLIRAAMLAPSGDNCQPWTFEWDGSVLRIAHDAVRGRHAFNRANHASYLSLGCVLESISIAARGAGYAVDPVVAKDGEPRATVGFREIPAVRDSLYDGLRLRHTDRRAYRRDPLATATLERLFADTVDFPDCGLTFADDLSSAFVSYAVACETFVWETRRAHDDLLRWIRFTNRSARESRDGMSWLNCGMNRLEALVIRLGRNAAVQRVLNAAGFVMGVQRNARKLLRSSAGLFCVTVKSHSVENLVSAGRLWMRAWCRLNLDGYSVQPVTAPTLPVYAAQVGCLESLPEKFRRLFERGADEIRRAFHLPPNETPIVMFRAGRRNPLPASHRTLRLPLERVFRSQSSLTSIK